MTKKWNGDHRFMIGVGSDGRRNDRTHRKFATSDRRFLKRSEKIQQVDNASINDINRHTIISCDNGGDGEV